MKQHDVRPGITVKEAATHRHALRIRHEAGNDLPSGQLADIGAMFNYPFLRQRALICNWNEKVQKAEQGHAAKAGNLFHVGFPVLQAGRSAFG